MTLNPGKTEIRAMVEVLETDFDSAEEAAAAVLAKAWELHEAKGKWTVAATRRHPKGLPNMSLSLGWYATEGQARSAAESLFFSAVSGEEYGYRVLPVHHGTPAAWHNVRKQVKKAHAEKEDAERLTQSIDDWVQRLHERAEQAKQNE